MPDTTSVGTILSVEEKHLTRSSDGAPFTLWKVRTHPLGELSTTKKEIADQAIALTEHAVLLTYSEKQNGDYVNRYLNKVGLAAQAPIFPQGYEQGAEAPQAPLHASVPPGSGAAVQQAQLANVTIGRDEAIWRQTATKTAASFNNKDLAEYWERVQMLLDFYRTGVVPGVAQDDAPHESFLPNPATMMPSQNTFIPPAPGDEGYNAATPVSDDDIPF